MTEPFSVRNYSRDGFKNTLSELTNDELLNSNKSQIEYLNDYFTEMNAETIIVEYQYIDRDYLEDYAAYYVRCFHRYEPKCSRLHFFSAKISEIAFRSVLKDASASNLLEEIKESYLGFIVVKPIPITFVGRTCLKTYPPENGRNYPSVRDYQVSLFGIDLTVSTLAFQEQDSIVAACATSALWSVFQGTGKLFHHSIPSPVEITKAATVSFPAWTRSFPNEGLVIEQIAQAIRSIGLEPYLVETNSKLAFLGNLYAYLSFGIPLLLGIDLYHKDRPDEVYGRHAVAVTGFHQSDQMSPSLNSFGLRVLQGRIDKIYVHDDQVGPFAKMNFSSRSLNWQDSKLETSWPDENGDIGNIKAVPLIFLVPLYHKIRITFEQIFGLVSDFDGFLKSNLLCNSSQQTIEWDIRLTDINSIKREILNHLNPAPFNRSEILTSKMPRYMWIARATKDKTKLFDLLFDATDIKQGHLFTRVVSYDNLLGLTIGYLYENLVTMGLDLPDTLLDVLKGFNALLPR